VRIWSQPTPVWRSASARHSAAEGGGSPPRRSSTTKSLPAPCILVKRRPRSGIAIALVGPVDSGRHGAIRGRQPGPGSRRSLISPISLISGQLGAGLWRLLLRVLPLALLPLPVRALAILVPGGRVLRRVL